MVNNLALVFPAGVPPPVFLALVFLVLILLASCCFAAHHAARGIVCLFEVILSRSRGQSTLLEVLLLLVVTDLLVGIGGPVLLAVLLVLRVFLI